jgi:GNAT superfamily N-acetyltransferase
MSAARWLFARLLTPGAPVRFVYHPPAEPVGLRVIFMHDQQGYDIGTLVWQVCSSCRWGSISKISIAHEWQRRGLGRRLISRALRDGPGYTWVTSSQSPDAKKFFPILTAETGVTFTQRGPACLHAKSHGRDGPAAQRKRWPKPVAERGILEPHPVRRPVRTAAGTTPTGSPATPRSTPPHAPARARERPARGATASTRQ